MSFKQDLLKAARERRIRMGIAPKLNLVMERSTYHQERMEREYPGIYDHNDRVTYSIKKWIAAGEGGDVRVPIDEIIEAVCKVYKVSRAELLGARRNTYLTSPRQHAMALAIDLRPDLSISCIARIFRRDHSSLINARNQWGGAVCNQWSKASKTVKIAAVNAILFGGEPIPDKSAGIFDAILSTQDAEPMVG